MGASYGNAGGGFCAIPPLARGVPPALQVSRSGTAPSRSIFHKSVFDRAMHRTRGGVSFLLVKNAAAIDPAPR